MMTLTSSIWWHLLRNYDLWYHSNWKIVRSKWGTLINCILSNNQYIWTIKYILIRKAIRFSTFCTNHMKKILKPISTMINQTFRYWAIKKTLLLMMILTISCRWTIWKDKREVVEMESCTTRDLRLP